MEIKKSPKADLERGKTLSVLMGFVVGLAVLFAGFEWSTRDVMVVQELSSYTHLTLPTICSV